MVRFWWQHSCWREDGHFLTVHSRGLSLVHAFGDREAERLIFLLLEGHQSYWNLDLTLLTEFNLMCVCVLSHVWLFATVWTTRGWRTSQPGSPVHEIFQARYTRMGCPFLLQGIFPTQRANPHLLHCRQVLYHCSIWKDLFNLNYLLKSPNSMKHKRYSPMEGGVTASW